MEHGHYSGCSTSPLRHGSGQSRECAQESFDQLCCSGYVCYSAIRWRSFFCIASSQSKTIKKTGTKMLKISCNLDDYTEDEKKAAMKSANGGSITIRMQVERARTPFNPSLAKGGTAKRIWVLVSTKNSWKCTRSLCHRPFTARTASLF